MYTINHWTEHSTPQSKWASWIWSCLAASKHSPYATATPTYPTTCIPASNTNPISQSEEPPTFSNDESEKYVCAPTHWVESHVLSHGFMRRGPMARVLCIPDFPCGTPGHAIRESKLETSQCKLTMYERGDCVEIVVHVSLLEVVRIC